MKLPNNEIACDLAGYFVIKVLKLLLHLQESHKECIGEDEFLFAEGEFDVDKLFILVDFYNRSFAEFLVYDSATPPQCF